MGRAIWFVVRYALVIGCVVYVFWNIDVSRLLGLAENYSVSPFLAALAFVFLIYLIPSLRLVHITDKRASLMVSYNAQMMGIGINNFLPAKLGEIAKAVYLGQQSELSASEGLVAVFWERFFDLNAILLLGAGAAYLSGQNYALVPLFAVVVAIWVVLAVHRQVPSLLNRVVQWVPWQRPQRVGITVLRQLGDRRPPLYYLIVGTYTLLGWVVFSGLFFLVILQFAGLSLSAAQVLAVFVAASLSMSVPSTPGALGVYESVIVISLGWFEVPREEALAIAIFLHFVQLLPTTLYTLALLAFGDLNLRELAVFGKRP